MRETLTQKQRVGKQVSPTRCLNPSTTPQRNWAPVTKYHTTQNPNMPKPDKTEFSRRKL